MASPIQIRIGEVADAPAILEYLRTLYNEWPNNIIYSPSDPMPTLEEEQQWIRGFAAPSLLLVAFDGETVVGTLTVAVSSTRAKIRHVGNLGIAIREGYRGQRIGERLMLAAIEHCQQNQVSRIGLSVYTRNTAAIALYKKLGFEIEGTLRNSALEDGKFFDEYAMSLLL